MLETIDVVLRMKRVSELLGHRIEVLRLTRQISQQTKETVDTRQREFLLREQLKTIQKELGEEDAKSEEIAELRKRIAEAGMPPEVESQAKKELARLERMPEGAAEYGMARAYLDWLIELPWSVTTERTIDIAEARRVLDEDHFGLAKVKRRILEYLAVQKLKPGGKSPILCFVGPPGVGKTSLGQSIARATGRKFVRVSLGGVHDEAEIRGHRRTYIGALPGNIVQSIRKAGARDCVMMLDEIDKLGAGIQGDPSAALLEVLDPEQNSTFRDAYLGVPFDLSSVLFIATANVLDNVPGPLRDRMEVIELPGYTEEEKLQIARRYLVPRQIEANGLDASSASASPTRRSPPSSTTTRARPACATSSARSAASSAARRCALPRARPTPIRIDAEDVVESLGPRRFENEVAMRTSIPGVATGLAWTPAGGDILFIEATRIARHWPAHPHRPARRCHEGERAGGAEPGQVARPAARHRRGDLRQERHPCACAGRRHPQGRTERRRRHDGRADLAAHQPADAQRHRDDRRDQPARPGAAGGRHQGEGDGGGARRHHHAAAAGAQQARFRGHPGRGAAQGALRLVRAHRRRRRRGDRDAAVGGAIGAAAFLPELSTRGAAALRA